MFGPIRSLIVAGVLGVATTAPQEAQAGRTSFSIGIGFGGYCGNSTYFGVSHGYYHPYYRSSWCGPVYHYSYCPPPVVYYSNPVYYSSPVVYAPAPAPIYRETVVVTQPRYAYVDSQPNTTQIAAQPATQAVYTPQPPQAAQPPAMPSAELPASAPSTTQYAPATPAAPRSAGDGWALLGANDTRSALDAFAADAERSMQSGVSKVGYSLSAAILGDESKSVWAMRRALLAEPESLNKIPLTAPIQAQMKTILQRLQTRVNDGFYRSDDLFLIAAFQFIDGQYPAADATLTRAINQGDKDQTTATLKTLIDLKIKGPWKYDYNKQ